MLHLTGAGYVEGGLRGHTIKALSFGSWGSYSLTICSLAVYDPPCLLSPLVEGNKLALLEEACRQDQSGSGAGKEADDDDEPPISGGGLGADTMYLVMVRACVS